MNILVVENDESIQAITKISLEIEVGWTVIKAVLGNKVLVKAEIYQPDAILLDVLPDLRGLNILKKLKRNFRTKSIPVILFTTQAGQLKILQFEKMEAAGLITKPFNPITLASQIVQILDRKVELSRQENIA